MARPLRIEFPGAIYHVTARGDRREDIFMDDADRACLLNVLALGLTRFDAVALAYCLMGSRDDETWLIHRLNATKIAIRLFSPAQFQC